MDYQIYIFEILFDSLNLLYIPKYPLIQIYILLFDSYLISLSIHYQHNFLNYLYHVLNHVFQILIYFHLLKQLPHYLNYHLVYLIIYLILLLNLYAHFRTHLLIFLYKD